MGPRRTLAEYAAGPLESARKVHPADPPEVRRKFAQIQADPRWVCSGLESAHLIAPEYDNGTPDVNLDKEYNLYHAIYMGTSGYARQQ